MSVDLNAIAAQIRAEGFQEGYAACLKEMEEFLSGRQKLPPQTSMKNEDIDRQNGQRSPRGQTKKWVRGVLASREGAMTVKQIQEILSLGGGDVPYSSIQNSLMQLDRDGEVDLVGRGLWKLKTNSAPSIETEGAE